MSTIITDGTGKSFRQKVNEKNEALTRSTIVEQRLSSAVDGDYYEYFSGLQTLTTANETPTTYLKNDSATDLLVIDRIFYDIFQSTGGPGGDGTWRFYRNPTVTGGTAVVPINTNFSSAGTADGTFTHTQTTMTGTQWVEARFTDQSSIAIEQGRIVLPQGASFGISHEPPTGNTSMALSVNVAFYFLKADLI